MYRTLFFSLTFPVLALAAGPDVPEINLVIQDHRYEPAEIHLSAGVKVKLLIENKDSTPEEFESHELNREKVIPGHSRAVIYVGPLSPGEYPFIGEFHPETAHGTLIVE